MEFYIDRRSVNIHMRSTILVFGQLYELKSNEHDTDTIPVKFYMYMEEDN